MHRGDFDYHPFYCEENAWRLVSDPRLQDLPRWVVFITNRDRTCAVWHQRAGAVDRPVIWDYHVIVVARLQAGLHALDLDTTLDFPMALDRYLQHTFAPPSRCPPAFRPMFRVVTGGDFLPRFASDRRHMKGEGGEWQAPPPPWAPIQGSGAPHDLDAWLDLDPSTDRGRVGSLETLLRLF